MYKEVLKVEVLKTQKGRKRKIKEHDLKAQKQRKIN